uniref:Uncharacterized protein n=1 Tax=Guillardia theta TaxID=55529 RepID=A0A7S4KYW5_GUITH|mmetsp:Transcript_34035/g.106620  ORF Transcript_34035/g.106620 Transcript_34035/m.106620 type:complete len:374 (+) Transcript_34035:81-1202(+)
MDMGARRGAITAIAMMLSTTPPHAFWSDRAMISLRPPSFLRPACNLLPTRPSLGTLTMRVQRKVQVEGQTSGGAESGSKRLRRPSNWWQDINQVKEELVAFCEAHNLPVEVLPSEREFRSYPGGMHVIHAIRKHGGFVKFGELVEIPARRPRESPPRTQRRKTTGRDEYGRFSEELVFQEHLLNYSKTIETWNWKVLPSNADLKENGRKDLINAIYRYGGRKHIAKKFGLLLTTEFNYLVEFYHLLKELRSYQEEKQQLGKMPSFKQLIANGRQDLARMICKHGGQNVLAARLDLQLDRPRKPYLVWGQFSIDFAIDLIEIAGQHSQDIGRTERILMPNATTLQSIHRADLIEKIEMYGGFVDVARRIGLDPD